MSTPYRHEWIRTRGIRLHAISAGDPRQPLVVCAHGALGGWFDFRYLVPAIAAAGYHAVAVDLRGCGQSDKPPSGYDLRSLTGDLYGVIHATGHDHAVVVGNHTGGALAWCLATHHPESVAGLISLAAAHPADTRRACLRRPWLYATPMWRHLLSYAPAAVLRNGQAIARMNVLANSASGFADTPAGQRAIELREQAYEIPNTASPRARLARIELGAPPRRWAGAPVTAPTLFLHDDTRPWHILRDAARQRVTGEFRALHLPGTKNVPHLESPEQCATILVDFLRTTTS